MDHAYAPVATLMRADQRGFAPILQFCSHNSAHGAAEMDARNRRAPTVSYGEGST